MLIPAYDRCLLCLYAKIFLNLLIQVNIDFDVAQIIEVNDKLFTVTFSAYFRKDVQSWNEAELDHFNKYHAGTATATCTANFDLDSIESDL